MCRGQRPIVEGARDKLSMFCQVRIILGNPFTGNVFRLGLSVTIATMGYNNCYEESGRTCASPSRTFGYDRVLLLSTKPVAPLV